MASATTSAEDDKVEIDASEPFKGIIVCCTSIPPEHRTEIAKRVADLGGVHKYDLTPDVTHLVVGDYDTPKYRHVARERPDVKAMDAGWIDAVNDLWKNDDLIDFRALEKDYQLKPLETCGVGPAHQQGSSAAARGTLLICLTGFGDQREEIAEKIKHAGGCHTGDLTRRCSHLIALKPEGKKFSAAKSWGVHTVTLDWLDQTIERGMILEETKFDPLLPADKQGLDAWIRKDPKRLALGKRSRSATTNGAAEEGTRKLRKTASMKLSSQTNNLWGDILGRPGSRDPSFAQENELGGALQTDVPTQSSFSHVDKDQAVFASCRFMIHGFSEQRSAILGQAITSMGGCVAPTLSSLSNMGLDAGSAQEGLFLVVPQSSQPETHPQVHCESIHVITEFYIENCLHNKRFFNPNEQVLGRPFPLFPIPSFSTLVICSAAFTGIELNQVSRSVTQLGAQYEEAFRKTASVLVCKSIDAVRKEKLKLALDWGVPVVPGDWLWECISTGFLAPIDDFIYPELKKRYTMESEEMKKKKMMMMEDAHLSRSSNAKSSKPSIRASVDTTAFDQESTDRPNARSSGSNIFKADLVTSADFDGAPTPSGEKLPPRSADKSSALSELSSASLNKSTHTATRPAATGPRRGINNPFVDSDSDSDDGDEGPPSDHASLPMPLGELKLTSKDPSVDASPQLLTRQETNGSTVGSERDGRRRGGPKQGDEKTTRQDQEDMEAEEEEKARLAKAAQVRQGLTSALSGLMQPAPSADGPDADRDRPRRRRQKIMGRAISNVSNGSSAASYDGNRLALDSVRGEDEEPDPPPATQLEYRDPQAQSFKAALMSKMAAGSAGEAAAAGKASKTLTRRKSGG